MKNTFDLYLIRHGHTISNGLGTVHGPEDQLSEKGMRQAEQLAHYIPALALDHLFISDRRRALQTAEHIARHTPISSEVTPLLRDISRPGAITNKHKDDPFVQSIYSDIYANWHKHDWHHSDDENFPEVKERALETLKRISANHDRVGAITHSNMKLMLLGVALYGRDFSADNFYEMWEEYPSSNASVSHLSFDPKHDIWRVVDWNNTNHLSLDKE